jgi:addiction module RelB/DinJ family antitoxin
MAQQINVNIRMDKDTKERADILFNALGFNFTTAINTFVKQALREQAIPFQPKLKRKYLDNYLEEYHGKDIETILSEAEGRGEKPPEIDWGKPVGEEIW